MNSAFSKTGVAWLAAGAAAGVALWVFGETTEATWMVVLGGVLLLPGVAAADLGAIKLLHERYPQRVQRVLLIVAAGGALCLVLAFVTGLSRLILVGVLLILPAVLMWFFWPIMLLLGAAAAMGRSCKDALARLVRRK